MTTRDLTPFEARLRVHQQERRAWIVLTAAALVFALLASGAVAAGRFYRHHATQPEQATLQVISGSGALVRSRGSSDWRIITETTSIREGDSISTALGTVVWLTLFDGSTVEVSEDTVVRVARMRSSRFVKATKHFILEPERGTVYIGMATRGAYEHSEFTTRWRGIEVTMVDEANRSDAGAYLFEVMSSPVGNGSAGAARAVRAAVLRGAAQLRTPRGTRLLTDDQQTVIESDGTLGPVSRAVRQFIQNGDFADDLTGWTPFQQQDPSSAGVVASEATVRLVSEVIDGREVPAVELQRAGNHANVAQAGIRQRIGKTLRVYSSLLLEFDAKIVEQSAPAGGEDGSVFPLVIQLTYFDVDGQEREWTQAYYIDAVPQQLVSPDRATLMDRDRWQHTIIDLRSLSPLPRQITSIVVYASGSGYRTLIANISLTSSELLQHQP